MSEIFTAYRSELVDCFVSVRGGVLCVSHDGAEWTVVVAIPQSIVIKFISETNKLLGTSYGLLDFDISKSDEIECA